MQSLRLEPIMRNEWEFNTGMRRMNLRNKRGKRYVVFDSTGHAKVLFQKVTMDPLLHRKSYQIS